jgi:hypothetical protein
MTTTTALASLPLALSVRLGLAVRLLLSLPAALSLGVAAAAALLASAPIPLSVALLAAVARTLTSTAPWIQSVALSRLPLIVTLLALATSWYSVESDVVSPAVPAVLLSEIAVSPVPTE